MATICHGNIRLHHFLTDQGAYIHEHYPETFEDCGDAESGPDLQGGPAFDRYEGDSHEFIVDSSGQIVAMMEIDWDQHRFYAGFTPHEGDPDDSVQYVRPRREGEDFIVTMRDEDGRWYACHGYGWTNDKAERGYYTQSHAEQVAARFNAQPHDHLTGLARAERVE